MRNFVAALGIATAGLLASAVPASAAPAFDAPLPAGVVTGQSDSWNQYRDRDWRDRRYNNRNSYRNDRRSWRGRDGRYYCRRDDGTTGLLIGGAVGGLAGHEIAGRGDRTLGTILGVAGGALLGREIDRGGSRGRCR